MLIKAIDIPYKDKLWQYSNPVMVQAKAHKYLGKSATVYKSSRIDKKYMIQNKRGKWIHFGGQGYEDYTIHGDKARRESYLRRSTNIRGQWAKDDYSPNSLSIKLLW